MAIILKSYAKDTFFEFIIHKKLSKAIIIFPGFPSNNNFDEIMLTLYKEGFNVFVPRYKGTFQSKGNFLKKDPINELSEFIEFLNKESTTNLWNQEEVKFRNEEIILIGNSFGANMALNVSITNNINKVVLFSPVWDFKNHNTKYKEQDLEQLTRFVKRGWNNLYRYNFDNIQHKMMTYSSCDWEKNKKLITNQKILVFHDPKDSSVSIEHSRKFERDIEQVKLIEHSSGHGINKELLSNDQLNSFLKK